MAIYVPTVQSEYILAGLFEEQTFAKIMAARILDVNTINAVFGVNRRAGDTVSVPRLAPMADFARIDVATTTALSPTAVAALEDKAVILRDVAINSIKKHDNIRSGEDLARKIGLSLGYKLAKRLIGQMANVLTGAVDACDDPSTNCHTQDETGYALKVDSIRKAKRLMGDEGERLTTLFTHSACWYDLLYDMIANYKIDVVGGQVINNGKLQSILGLQNVIVSDLIADSGYGDTTTGDDAYNTFLLGEGCMYFAYQHEPEIEQDIDILKPSTLSYIKVSMDYLMHLVGLAWGGSTNPADSDLATPSNYGEAYSDHREVRAVHIINKGGCYTT